MRVLPLGRQVGGLRPPRPIFFLFLIRLPHPKPRLFPPLLTFLPSFFYIIALLILFFPFPCSGPVDPPDDLLFSLLLFFEPSPRLFPKCTRAFSSPNPPPPPPPLPGGPSAFFFWKRSLVLFLSPFLCLLLFFFLLSSDRPATYLLCFSPPGSSDLFSFFLPPSFSSFKRVYATALHRKVSRLAYRSFRRMNLKVPSLCSFPSLFILFFPPLFLHRF